MANRRYGNAGSVSSLISSARSAYEREQAYQDQIAAYEWDLSAKTAEDHDKYVGCLTKRNKELETRDPAKALTVASKINSTRSSFASKEIQRASIAVNYGQGTDSDKYNKMMGLYENAVNNGDYDLAQNLEAQLGTLQIKIQNARSAAASAGAAASSAAYTATKKGVTAKLDPINRALKVLEDEFANKQIDRAAYLTNKTQLLTGKKNILDTVAPRDDNSEYGVGNPLGLKPEDLMTFAQQNSDIYQGANAKLLGQAGVWIAQGASPFTSSIDPLTQQVTLKDRKMVGESYMGPKFADNISGDMDKEYKKIWAQLGFDNKAGAGGRDVTLKDGRTVRAFVDPNSPNMAVFRDGGLLYQVTPDREVAMVSQTADGKFESPLLAKQQKISVDQYTKEFDKQFGGAAGVARVAGDVITDAGDEMVKATKMTADKIGSFIGKNTKKGSIGGAIQQVADKSMEILGLRKRAEEKAVAERAAQARMLEANRAEAARQQATYQAQLAKSTVPALPGKQLSYNWKTGKVENKLSPVFKDPLSNDPALRTQQVIRGALPQTSIYNKLR